MAGGRAGLAHLRGSRLLNQAITLLPADLKAAFTHEARILGFDCAGVTAPDAIAEVARHFRAFIDEGAHGDMDWLAASPQRRMDPRVLWPGVRSVIMLGVNYGPDENPLEILQQRTSGAISVYAQGDDYHDVIKKRLKLLARWLAAQSGAEVKVFVDTAAVMEKPLAQAAGLGWQGKHTNLVSREFGSWLFLGAIFTAADLPRLQYTRMVFAEALRLYPPAWLMTRRAREEVVIGDYRFPAGTFFLISQYLTHRDPRFFPEPEAFVPTRWAAPPDAGPAQYAYFPFGGGPRQCLGEGFAWMEGLLVLATVAQTWRMALVPGPPVEPWGLVTLRPKQGIPVRLTRR